MSLDIVLFVRFISGNRFIDVIKSLVLGRQNILKHPLQRINSFNELLTDTWFVFYNYFFTLTKEKAKEGRIFTKDNLENVSSINVCI